MRRLFRPLVAIAVVTPLAASCASILGIEKADLETASTSDAGGSLCDEYCSKALANCSGQFELYPTRDFCLAVCAALPEGKRTDTSGNTVGCRLHFAESAAVVEKPVNCSAAGPGGNGVCGDNCESWCTLESQICPSIYASTADCLAACNTFPVLGSYNDTLPTQTGNSFECRLYHVTAAAGIDPVLHCPHTDINNTKTPCK
ncbi:MAG TPA: hypothetical protein VHC69_32310 [Polyangiaceae bacterium]|nr:hypothetical protein [Polyangiaceae bacterium]